MNIFNEITISIKRIQQTRKKQTNKELRRSVKMVFREIKVKNTTKTNSVKQ